MIKLGFYKVDNSKNYGRHTFDGLYDKPEEIERMLAELPDEEVKIFSASSYGYDGTTPWPNLADFEEDYNDEELDCGWWCVVIRKEEPKHIWVLFAESLYDYEIVRRVISVFKSEDDARKAFAEEVKKARKCATTNEWTIGNDDANFFEAYPDGSCGTSHETVELNQTEINKKITCRN